ncbi:NAD(P)-binding protein [Roridomyces roridus]|uniref:NAD(P)-binding protein n=1 Tax=Roridomyces roridus TaxID=1738132 RepID=A0AAD7C1T4_9AGAR|nr:NAD(P)-binding protein [Roridomyces roridus]
MGGVLALISKPSFVPERDIPDLTGKVAIVTGGNVGIGYQTVKQLLLKDAKVYLAARSPDKATAAIKSLEAETNGKKAIFLKLDLGDLKSVRTAADNFLKQEEKLDLLFNNAGVMNTPLEMLTAQGVELQFGTNVLGHFFFTELLLPALTKSFQHNQVPARVISTSSTLYTLAPGPGVEFASLKGGSERDAWLKKTGKFLAPWRLYGQSKMGNILASNYLAKTHSDVLVSCAVHPGVIRSELQRHQPGWMQVLVNSPLYPTPMGALAQLWAGTVATPAEITGQYVVPWGKVVRTEKRAKNAKLEAEMIAFLKEQIQGF